MELTKLHLFTYIHFEQVNWQQISDQDRINDDKEVIASDIQSFFISDRWNKIKTHILKYVLKHDVSHKESHCIITF